MICNISRNHSVVAQWVFISLKDWSGPPLRVGTLVIVAYRALHVFLSMPVFPVKSTRNRIIFNVSIWFTLFHKFDYQMSQEPIHYFYLKCIVSFKWITAFKVIWTFFLSSSVLHINFYWFIHSPLLLRFHVSLIFIWI